MSRARFERRNGRPPWDTAPRGKGFSWEKFFKVQLKAYEPFLQRAYFSEGVFGRLAREISGVPPPPKSRELALAELRLWGQRRL